MTNQRIVAETPQRFYRMDRRLANWLYKWNYLRWLLGNAAVNGKCRRWLPNEIFLGFPIKNETPPESSLSSWVKSADYHQSNFLSKFKFQRLFVIATNVILSRWTNKILKSMRFHEKMMWKCERTIFQGNVYWYAEGRQIQINGANLKKIIKNRSQKTYIFLRNFLLIKEPIYC